MPARLLAFLVWILVAASAAFWGLRLIVRAPQAPERVTPVAEATMARGDLTRLLGAAPVAAAAAAPVDPGLAARVQLLGVMAAKPPATQGYALIALDGKMPRAYRVGASIDGELVLQSVSLRAASIGRGGGLADLVLELPVLPAAATGTLPPASMDGRAGLNPAVPELPPVHAVPNAVTAVPPPPPGADGRAPGGAMANGMRALRQRPPAPMPQPNTADQSQGQVAPPDTPGEPPPEPGDPNPAR